MSVCEGSERQQGGRLTYTLHSSRFCAESVLMAVERAAALPHACLSRPWRRVDPSLRALDLPQRSQPPPPESSHPAICATRWSARSRVRRAVGQRYPREVLLVADSGRALEISSRPRRPAPARPQATVVSRRRAERGSGLRARLAAEQRTCQRPAAGQEERDEQRKWRGEPARARA